jgi:3-phosphoshikimate 1-carboxyvinyltransferase
VLQALGAGIDYLGEPGYPPIAVHAGGLRGGLVTFRSPKSTQFVSALLLAAPYAGGDIFIEATGNVPSTPYLELTTDVMDRFGVTAIEQRDDMGLKYIVATPQRYQGTTYAIEPDASSATYFLAAAAVAGGRVTVEHLGTDSAQGDVRFVDVLEQMGCRVERGPTELTVYGPLEGERLHGIDLDLGNMPDTSGTLAVLALFADGPTVVRNIGNLRIKETDRITALSRELAKLGARVDEWSDGLRVNPPERITPAEINTYDDHRMAMSFTLAGLKCPGLVINNPRCCGKTFPDFFDRFERMLGADG